MNLCGDGRTEQSKAATEDREIWCSVGIEVGEAAVHQVAAQFPFQIAEAPAFQMLHDTAAQQTIGAKPRRPVRVERGLRFARHWRTKSTKAGSSKRRSTGSSKSSLSRAACWARGE